MSINAAQQIPENMLKYDSSKMEMNFPKEELLENIRTNIQRFLPQVKAYPKRKDSKIILVGGGPSLEGTFDELKAQVEDGVKLIAVNNTHDWLLDRGLTPSAMIMVDARPSNVRFVQRPISTCKYLIASQCDPSVFDSLSGHNTWIWHAKNDEGEKEILDNYYMGQWLPIIGGSTVILRSIWILRMLGFTEIDIYGFDSCMKEDQHHAYDQPENDASPVMKVTCAGKEFYASAWMLSQADDFMHFVKKLGEHFQLNVHGDGLISHIIHEGAGYERIEN